MLQLMIVALTPLVIGKDHGHLLIESAHHSFGGATSPFHQSCAIA